MITTLYYVYLKITNEIVREIIFHFKPIIANDSIISLSLNIKYCFFDHDFNILLS